MSFPFKNWRDRALGPPTTPVDAAGLEDLEQRVAGYIDDQVAGAGANPYADMDAGRAAIADGAGGFVSGTVSATGVAWPRLEVAGHSWSIDADPWEGWPSKLGRMLGVDRARTSLLGVGGATATGAANGTPVGMAAKVLQSNHQHYHGDAPIAGDWVPGSGVAVAFLGYNDVALNPTAKLPVQAAMRATIARFRAARVYEDSLSSKVGYGAGWSAAGTTILNSGSGFAYTTTSGAAAQIAMPDDYDGRPLTIGYVSNGAAPMNGTLTVHADADQVATFNLRPEEAQRGTLAFPGAVRLPNGVPLGTDLLTLTWALDSGAMGSFDYLAFEDSNPLVIVPLMPRPPASYDPGNTHRPRINTANAWALEVASEFPPDQVLVVDFRESVLDGNADYWVGVNDPHPSLRGHDEITAVLARAITDAASDPRRRAGGLTQKQGPAASLSTDPADEGKAIDARTGAPISVASRDDVGSNAAALWGLSDDKKTGVTS